MKKEIPFGIKAAIFFVIVVFFIAILKQVGVNKSASQENITSLPTKVESQLELSKKKINGEKRAQEINIEDEKKSMRVAFCYQLDQNLSMYDVDVKIVTPDCVKLIISGDKSMLISVAAEIQNDIQTKKRLRELGFEEIYFTNMWGYQYHLYL